MTMARLRTTTSQAARSLSRKVAAGPPAAILPEVAAMAADSGIKSGEVVPWADPRAELEDIKAEGQRGQQTVDGALARLSAFTASEAKWGHGGLGYATVTGFLRAECPWLAGLAIPVSPRRELVARMSAEETPAGSSDLLMCIIMCLRSSSTLVCAVAAGPGARPPRRAARARRATRTIRTASARRARRHGRPGTSRRSLILQVTPRCRRRPVSR